MTLGLSVLGGVYLSGRAVWPQGRVLMLPIGFVFGAPATSIGLHAAGKLHFPLNLGLFQNRRSPERRARIAPPGSRPSLAGTVRVPSLATAG